jgi:hypothetical protein
MADLYNATGIIGQVLTNGNNYVTGSETYTMLIILITFMVYSVILKSYQFKI